MNVFSGNVFKLFVVLFDGFTDSQYLSWHRSNSKFQSACHNTLSYPLPDSRTLLSRMSCRGENSGGDRLRRNPYRLSNSDIISDLGREDVNQPNNPGSDNNNGSGGQSSSRKIGRSLDDMDPNDQLGAGYDMRTLNQGVSSTIRQDMRRTLAHPPPAMRQEERKTLELANPPHMLQSPDQREQGVKYNMAVIADELGFSNRAETIVRARAARDAEARASRAGMMDPPPRPNAGREESKKN
jgi:hypothetical protein